MKINTLKRIVKYLVIMLTNVQKQKIMECEVEGLEDFRNTLGQLIINDFGLCSVKSPIRSNICKVKGIKSITPHEASMVVMETLWKELRRKKKKTRK